MTKNPVVRDNAYYLDRLKRDHPVIHADHLAGMYPTVQDALRAAGLKVKRTRLQELKNAYIKATPAEQKEFRLFIGCAPTSGSTAAPRSVSSAGISATSLSPPMIADIVKIMTDRKMKMGQVMRELGVSPHDQSISRALTRGSQIEPELKLALERWIAKWTI